jgi:hypothetical protein
LCQILGVGNRLALAADESENRSPISFAKFGKGSVRLLFVASRICAGQNHAPPRRYEAVRVASVGRRRI